MITFTFAAVTPAIRNCLDFEVCPETISTSLFGTPSVFAKSLINSVFAAPSTGGEATLTFTAPSSAPTISDLDARGTTLTANNTAPSFSEMLIKTGMVQFLTKTFNTIDCRNMITISTIIAEISNMPNGGINF